MENVRRLGKENNLYKAVSFCMEERMVGMVPLSLLLLTSLQKKQ